MEYMGTMQSSEYIDEDLLPTSTNPQANSIAAQEANRRMDNFISIACHELKTPLTSIKGFIQLSTRRLQHLKNSQNSEQASTEIASIHTLLSRTNSQIERLNNLMNDFLDVARLQSDQIELNRTSCDLVTITRQVVQHKQSLHPKRVLQLLDPIPEKLPIIADPQRIGQVIANYLSNSLKYTVATKPIIIQLENTGLNAMLSVIDRGPGLSKAEQQQIWQRFYRVEGIEVQNGSDIGLGLGLYLNETIIKKHQGQIGVESQPEQGSRFWFSLPLAMPTHPES